MGGFEGQVKKRAKEVEKFFMKGFKMIGNSFKKGWRKVKHIGR